MIQLYKNIKDRRLALGLTQEELAELVGYSGKSMIARIEKGDVDLPLPKVIAIAKALRISPAELVGWDSQEASSDARRGVKIPVLGDVAAGVPIDAIEYYIDEEEIDSELASKGEYFGLRIHGDSMSPRILDGDIVIVRCQREAETGDLVIVRIDSERAMCKQLVKHEDSITLMSFNPSYPPVTFSKKEINSKPVQIIGKVVELRGKFY